MPLPAAGAADISERFLQDAQVAALPAGTTGIALPIPGLRDVDAAGFSLAGAAQFVRDELDRRNVAAVELCGLSLGAMVATRFAIDYPDRTASLILSGGQVHPSRTLMSVPKTVLRVLPARLAAPAGVSKKPMLGVLGQVVAVDFRGDLARIAAPALVMCASRDKANLPAARDLAAGIPGAELQIVPSAGHEWNTDLPDEFSTRLNAFLARTRDR